MDSTQQDIDKSISEIKFTSGVIPLRFVEKFVNAFGQGPYLMSNDSVIMGNIGCGKSTAIDNINDKDIKCIKENVEHWTNSGLLRNNYENPNAKSEYKFKDHTERTDYTNLEALQYAVYDHFVETEYGIEKDLMNYIYERCNIDSEMIFREHSNWTENFKLDYSAFSVPKIIFYIHTPLSICQHRISNRDRDSESKISIEFLENIENRYVFLCRLMNYLGTRVHVIDGTLPSKEIANIIITETLRQDNPNLLTLTELSPAELIRLRDITTLP